MRLAGRAQPRPIPANVLLVTIDTLRADRLGAYGYPLARTPVLDRLAAKGVRFARCDGACAADLSRRMSAIVTGRYPANSASG